MCTVQCEWVFLCLSSICQEGTTREYKLDVLDLAAVVMKLQLRGSCSEGSRAVLCDCDPNGVEKDIMTGIQLRE